MHLYYSEIFTEQKGLKNHMIKSAVVTNASLGSFTASQLKPFQLKSTKK